MDTERQEDGTRPGISKLKLAVGAAGLLLFIVGVKRSFRLGDVAVEDGDLLLEEEEAEEPEDAHRDALLGRRRHAS